MQRTNPHLRIAPLSLVLLALALLLAPLARAGNSSNIVRESAKTLEGGNGRVASFWWLPQEYWEQVAKELNVSAEEQAKVRTAFRDYLLVAALETKLETDKKAEFATIADIVKRAKFFRDGKQIEVLREVSPEVVRFTRSLVYLLRTSLGGLGEGLRLLPLPNVDAQGNPILTGTAPGELRIEYRFDDKAPAQSVYWRAPLTSVAGTKKCPKGGEPLEANFAYCPWHGEKVD